MLSEAEEIALAAA
jgi:hypothetical protein